MTTKEKIEVMQAFDEGKTVQFKNFRGDWVDLCNPSWDWRTCEYRIKTEPAYREYKNTDEMIDDVRRRFRISNPVHFMPLIWVKDKDENVGLVTGFYGVYVHISGLMATFRELAEDYTYLDGSPCGKLAEE